MISKLFSHCACMHAKSLQSCPTLCDPMDCVHQASLSFTVSSSLLKLMSIELVILCNNLILCCPLLLPSIFSSVSVFSSEALFTSDGHSIGASNQVMILLYFCVCSKASCLPPPFRLLCLNWRLSGVGGGEGTSALVMSSNKITIESGFLCFKNCPTLFLIVFCVHPAQEP